MPKKYLVFSIFAFFVGFSLTFVWFLYSINIKKKVLTFLKEKLEFCEIVKSKISFGKGNFWLICNGRPFFAEYENGRVSYELNGWGFLKNNPLIFQELQKCDFYDSRKVDSSTFQLIFFCEDGNARVYQFSKENWEIKKIKELQFQNIVLEDLINSYAFLLNCKLYDINYFADGRKNPFSEFSFDCNGKKFKLGFYQKTPISPPFYLDLPTNENVEIAFKNAFRDSFIKDIRKSENNKYYYVEGMRGSLESPLVNFSLLYDFENNISMFLITPENFEKLLKEMGNYFLFPPIKNDKIYFVGPKKIDGKNIIIYKVAEKIIIAEYENVYEPIKVYLKDESFLK